MQVPLSEIAEGTVLGADLMDGSGNVLLPAGTALSMALIESLERRGVTTVPVPGIMPKMSEAEWQAAQLKTREAVDRLFRYASPGAAVDRLREAVLSYRLNKLRGAYAIEEPSGHGRP